MKSFFAEPSPQRSPATLRGRLLTAVADFPPHYTRPADFRGWKVPEVLIGMRNHSEVAKWRRAQALERYAPQPSGSRFGV